MNILEQREIHEPDSAQRSHYYKWPQFSTRVCKVEKANAVDWLERINKA